MAVGTSLGAYYDSDLHHQAGMENNVIDPETTPDLGTRDKNIKPVTAPKTSSTMPVGGSTEPAGALKSQGGTSVPPETQNTSDLLPEGSFPDLLHLDAKKDVDIIKGFYDTVKNAFKLPGDVYAGKIDPMSQQGIERAADLAGLMVTGPAPVAAKMADGTLGSFAGVRSRTAPKETLKTAQDMYTGEGHTAEDIWKSTGWFKDNMDGRWKYEISDQGAKLKEGFDPSKNYVNMLDQVLDHPELFKAYPHLKDIPVTINNRLGGDLGTSGPNGITLNIKAIEAKTGPEGVLDVLNHEIQHKIQDYEKFNTGSSPERAFKDVRSSLADVIHRTDEKAPELSSLQKLYSDMSAINTRKLANYLYQRVPGEVEANRSMTRRLLTDEQRQNWSPEEYDKFMEGSKNYMSGGEYYTPSGIPFKTSDASAMAKISRRGGGGGDYWSSTTSPRQMMETPIDPKVAAYLRENRGVDPSLLSKDLGIHPKTIESYQRRLGLRAFANTAEHIKNKRALLKDNE